jgi:heme/copper-type cytochrome/quinol oxidase subunit 1
MAVSAEAVTPTWKEGPVVGWLTTVDHKRIGLLYIVTAFLFFLAGGVMALLMRIQLMQANQDFITRDAYNALFTMHGTTMIFLFVVPVLAGFGNYLIPLMIGAKDMAFPRLNAMSYWFFLAGGVCSWGASSSTAALRRPAGTRTRPCRAPGSAACRSPARTCGSSPST